MRLTLHTDYSLRLLLLLALAPNELHTIATVAKSYGISRNHMMKVAQTLIQAGFVESVRGRRGGLKLAKKPTDIVLGAVVRKTEDDLALTGCFDHKRSNCILETACVMRKPLHQALAAFLEVLDGYTLADVLHNPSRISRMRNILAQDPPKDSSTDRSYH
jgi:Rrf2 family transcriptional regulator, nitric oxide-sensitive transcriptional repressor